MTRPRKWKSVEPPALDKPILQLERANAALEIFQRAGWGPDSKWLSSVVLEVVQDPEVGKPASDDVTKLRLEAVARTRSGPLGIGNRDACLLAAFARLCGVGGKGTELPRLVAGGASGPEAGLVVVDAATRKRLANEFCRDREDLPGADFVGALIAGGWPGDYRDDEFASKVILTLRARLDPGRPAQPGDEPALFRLIRVLVEDAGVSAGRVWELGGFSSEAMTRWPRDFDPQDWRRLPPARASLKPELESPRHLTPWLFALGLPVLRDLLDITKKARPEVWGANCLGVRCAIQRWVDASQSTLEEAGQVLADAVAPWLNTLTGWLRGSREAARRPDLRRAWFWFGLCVVKASPEVWSSISESDRETLLQGAVEEIGRHRKLFASARPRGGRHEGWGNILPPDVEAPDEEKVRAPWEEFEWAWDQLQVCIDLLFRAGGVWRGLKPALLAWRSLATPGVANDLRYWPEDGRSPLPEPWARLFAWPMQCLEDQLHREMKDDPDLVVLRGEIARYCLERLVDKLSKADREDRKKRTDKDMLEPSPAWRYHLIRAMSGLGVNPEGKGHRVLLTSVEIDPDEDVRAAAKDAHERMRRNTGQDQNVTPERAILTTLWWIRLAHLVALDQEVDADGAQRTYMKEVKRVLMLTRNGAERSDAEKK